jgi:hypothetical protein
MSTITLQQLKSASSEDLLKLVDRRHPRYSDKVEHWRFMESCYEGGRSWIDENIFTYHKEGVTEFERRKSRAYRFPHSREVISLVNKYLFKGAIDRQASENLPPEVREFWGATTLLKRPIADFMDNVSTWTSTLGRVWVVVDNNLSEMVVSEQDRKLSKGRSYAYILKSPDALDFSYDDDGELEWFLNSETYRDISNPLTSSGALEQRYRIWTKTFWATIRIDKSDDGERTPSVQASGEHSLGLVPVFPADHIPSDEPYTSPGMIDEVAYLDRAVANYLSNLDVIIQDQTFSQLAIPHQGLLPSATGDDEGMGDIQVMGTSRVFLYNSEGGSAPEFISPDVKQANIIMSTITKIVDEIYHSIGMAGERTKQDNATGIDNSSGVAKAYDFERLNAMLAAKARALQNVEKNMVRLILAWNKDPKELQDVENYVTYPSTFDVRSLADELDSAQRLAVILAPKSIRRMQMVRLASKMFPQATPEEIEEISKDVEGDWLEDIIDPLTDAPVSADALKTSNVPGKRNSQGENNKDASVKLKPKVK